MFLAVFVWAAYINNNSNNKSSASHRKYWKIPYPLWCQLIKKNKKKNAGRWRHRRMRTPLENPTDPKNPLYKIHPSPHLSPFSIVSAQEKARISKIKWKKYVHIHMYREKEHTYMVLSSRGRQWAAVVVAFCGHQKPKISRKPQPSSRIHITPHFSIAQKLRRANFTLNETFPPDYLIKLIH